MTYANENSMAESTVASKRRIFIMSRKMRKDKSMMSWVCCGVDYPHLLDGDCDYIIYTRSNAWDHLPGTLMVAEAGGAFGQADGSPYTRRSDVRGLVVAADPQTYAMVQPLAQEALTRSR